MRLVAVGASAGCPTNPASLTAAGAALRTRFGTAAEYAVVRSGQAVALPAGVPLKQGACLG